MKEREAGEGGPACTLHLINASRTINSGAVGRGRRDHQNQNGRQGRNSHPPTHSHKCNAEAGHATSAWLVTESFGTSGNGFSKHFHRRGEGAAPKETTTIDEATAQLTVENHFPFSVLEPPPRPSCPYILFSPPTNLFTNSVQVSEG